MYTQEEMKKLKAQWMTALKNMSESRKSSPTGEVNPDVLNHYNEMSKSWNNRGYSDEESPQESYPFSVVSVIGEEGETFRPLPDSKIEDHIQEVRLILSPDAGEIHFYVETILDDYPYHSVWTAEQLEFLMYSIQHVIEIAKSRKVK